jgi:hypothetical protein
MQSQEEIMKNIIDLVREGAGGVLAPEEESFLRGRYYGWIIKKKEGVPTTPQQVWDTEDGKKIQKKIKEIGKLFSDKKQKESKKILDDAECADVCRTVETSITAPCPHCPDGDPTG